MRRTRARRWMIGLLLLGSVLVVLLAGGFASAKGICYTRPATGPFSRDPMPRKICTIAIPEPPECHVHPYIRCEGT